MMRPPRPIRGIGQPHHQREDKGGDKKQRDNRNEDSRTGNQNSGHGGHK